MAEDVKARLAAAREAQAKRDAEREAERDARDLAFLELIEKCEKEIGPRGDAFEIVDVEHEGPIALKRIDGAAVLYKRFQAAMNGGKDPSPEDLDAFVRPCLLHPDKAVFGALLERRPHVLLRCANALATLFGAKEEHSRSKF